MEAAAAGAEERSRGVVVAKDKLAARSSVLAHPIQTARLKIVVLFT